MLTWLPALNDSYFRKYLFLVATILLGFAILLLIFRLIPKTQEGSKRIWHSFWPWFIMAPIIFLCLGISREIFIVSLVLLSLCCVKEFSLATGLYKDWGFVGTVYMGIFGFYTAALTHWYGLFVAIPVYAIIVILMIPSLRNDYRNMIQKVGLSTMALIYLGWFPAHLAFLRDHPNGLAYLLFLIIGTELNDAAAFTIGKLFGKRPLVSEISPKKTVEGSLGALLVTILYVGLVGPWLPGFNPFLLILSVIILWIGGTMGDLVISFVKRDIGIKDMGTLIPGHGGLLDRVDSLIFVSPLFFHMVNYYVQFPGGLP